MSELLQIALGLGLLQVAGAGNFICFLFAISELHNIRYGNDGESDLRVKHDVHWLGLCNATRSIVWSSRLEPVCLNLGEQAEKDGRNETPRALQVVLPGLKHLKTSWIYWLMLYHSPSYMNILCVATVILTLSNVSSLSRALQVSSELSYYLC